MLLGSAMLETAVGLALIYILASLICSTANEWCTRIRSLRPSILGSEVLRLLGPNIAGALGKHPLMRGTFENGRYPQYLPPSTFAAAIVDLAYLYTPGPAGQPGSTSVVRRWQGRDRILFESLRQGATSLGPIQTRVERWFELAMEQATGRFKRQTQIQVLILSGVLSAGAKLDSLAIAGRLYTGAIQHDTTKFPIGWGVGSLDLPAICGIALTWAAVSLGAPFWFDLLNKFVNLRQTGLPPDEDARSRSGDRFAGH